MLIYLGVNQGKDSQRLIKATPKDQDGSATEISTRRETTSKIAEKSIQPKLYPFYKLYPFILKQSYNIN